MGLSCFRAISGMGWMGWVGWDGIYLRQLGTLEHLAVLITYNNLKRNIFLNALTEVDKNSIWLPIVIYANTDQKMTTRLGWIEEWSTEVVVSRDGKLTRY